MSQSSALQAALAGEHAAVYAYGVVGAVVDPTGPTAGLARDAFDVHAARRDELDELVGSLGDDPVPAEPGYALPVPVTSADDAELLARQVEDHCAVLYAAVVASTTDQRRLRAAGWLEDAATRALAWGSPSAAFPGVGLP